MVLVKKSILISINMNASEIVKVKTALYQQIEQQESLLARLATCEELQ